MSVKRQLEHQARCPLCGKDVKEAYTVRAYLGNYLLSIGECSGCRLALLISPPPLQDSICYMTSRYSSKDSQDRYTTDLVKKKKTCQNRLKLLNLFNPPNKKLLDIGAGNGIFCSTAKAFGYDAYGTEICAQAVKQAKELFGVRLIFGDITSISSYPQFGIVTMWDVIEHLRDPLKMLIEVESRMVEDGIIIIQTGNYDSFNRLKMKERWPLYSFDHMFYFSPQSLKTLVQQAGFSDVQFHQMPISRSIFSLCQKGFNALLNPAIALQDVHQFAITKIRRTCRTHTVPGMGCGVLLATARKSLKHANGPGY